MVEELDQNLHHFAAVVRRDVKENYENTPGAGAAGGLGFGLLTFTNATIQSGVEAVLEMTHFKEKQRMQTLFLPAKEQLTFKPSLVKLHMVLLKQPKKSHQLPL